MKNFICSLLSAERGSLSSKRLCGAIGWLSCSAVLIICTIKEIQAPEMVDLIVYASAALLGLDSVANIWKKDSANQSTNQTTTNNKTSDK